MRSSLSARYWTAPEQPVREEPFPPTRRWRLTIEYDGTPFVGWQRQEVSPSVQEVLENAFAQLAGMNVRLYVCGRTDAGVHALGQVAHLDLPTRFDGRTIREAANFHAQPHPVSILEAEPVSGEFDARRSATGREYRYRIVNRRARLTLDQGRAWHVPQPLDTDAMALAAARLLGHHDFTSFRASQCQASSPMRTLDRLAVTRDGDEVVITAKARSFLHHQVRNITGTLVPVGLGKCRPEDISRILAARNRSAAGETAPASGLYFVRAFY